MFPVRSRPEPVRPLLIPHNAPNSLANASRYRSLTLPEAKIQLRQPGGEICGLGEIERRKGVAARGSESSPAAAATAAAAPPARRAVFDWSDPFALESSLSDEERMVRDTARAFSREELLPRVVEAFREERVDRGLFRELGALGFLGSTIDGYGCAGANYTTYGLVAREIEAVDSGYRSMMSVQSSLVMHPIHAYGTEAQREKFLPRLATGEWVGCFGLTEPDHGSDPGGMKTRAVPADGGWRLTGSKSWITNSPIADVFVVWAKVSERDESGGGERDVIRGFILEKGMAGLDAPKIIRQALDAVLDHGRDRDGRGVRAGGEPPPGGARPRRAVRMPRPGPATASRGGRWGRPKPAGTRRASTPSSDGSSGARSPPTSSCSASSRTCRPRSPSGSRALSRPGGGWTRGDCPSETISLVKRNNCGKALDIARAARDLHGGNGIHEEFHVMRHAINLETVNTYEGTHDIHALILGRAQTGIQAFT